MRRLIIAVIMLIALVAPLAVSGTLFAVDVLQPENTTGPCNNPAPGPRPEICGDNQSNAVSNPLFGPGSILNSLINVLSAAVGVVSVVIIIVSGLRLVLAGGDSSAAATARRSIAWAAVGVGVAAIAQAIVTLVLNKL